MRMLREAAFAGRLRVDRDETEVKQATGRAISTPSLADGLRPGTAAI